jgi:hypothetical protein
MGVGLHSRANASPCQGNEHLLLCFICAVNTNDLLYTKYPRFPPHDPLSRTLGGNAMVKRIAKASSNHRFLIELEKAKAEEKAQNREDKKAQ